MLNWRGQGKGVTSMKKEYTKPTVMSEGVFEVLSAGCGLADPNDDSNCDTGWGGAINLTLGASA